VVAAVKHTATAGGAQKQQHQQQKQHIWTTIEAA